MKKLSELHQKIYSEKFPQKVQIYLDNFNLSLLNALLETDYEVNLKNDNSKLSQNKQDQIYSFKYLLVEKHIKDLKNSFLIEQKIQSSDNPNFKNFKQLNENKLKEALIKKRNMRFYNFQFLFTEPKDYLELHNDEITKNKENNLINKINISPDKVHDNILIKLWLVWEEYNELLEELKNSSKWLDIRLLKLEILKKKIEAIKKLKEEFKNLNPLKVSRLKDTTRIMTIWNWANAGKIVLTQSPEMFNKNKSWTWNLDMNKSIYIFDDIFSFLRSQIYSLRNIEDKKEAIKNSKEKSGELSQNWNNKETDDLKWEVEKITEELKWYNTYFESKVKNSRVPKIRYKNPITDSSVMYWIKNDLWKWFLKLNANQWVINSQVEIIKEDINEQIKKYKNFLNNFTNFINTLDQNELTYVIKSNNKEEIENCFNENEQNFRIFIRLINNFLIWWSESISNPFKDFYIDLLSIQKDLSRAIKQKDTIAILRKILGVNLLIKLKVFEIYEYTLQNSIKLNDNFLENNYKLVSKLDKYRELLTNKNFLWSFNILGKTNDKYQEKLIKIDKIKEKFKW